jgi:hypothetical protein
MKESKLTTIPIAKCENQSIIDNFSFTTTIKTHLGKINFQKPSYSTMSSSITVPPDSEDIVRDMEKPLITKEKQRVGRNLSVKFADAILDWVIFPSLLFIQFGATMYCQKKQGTLSMSWEIVLLSVAIFCLVSIMYRKIYRVHPIQSMILLLLPEVFTNGILAMVMFTGLENSFKVMLGLTAVLAMMSGVGSVHITTISRQAAVGNYERILRDEDDNSDNEWVC